MEERDEDTTPHSATGVCNPRASGVVRSDYAKLKVRNEGVWERSYQSGGHEVIRNDMLLPASKTRNTHKFLVWKSKLKIFHTDLIIWIINRGLKREIT